MNKIEYKQAYTAPVVQVLALDQPLHLLVSLSAEAGIEDWEEGEEL